MNDDVVLGHMTDAVALVQIARVRAAYKQWSEHIGLGGWTIDHHYFRGGWAHSRHHNQWATAAAETWADFRYRHATMHWDLAQIEEMADAKLARLVLHELVHCLTDQFKEYACHEMAPDSPPMPAAEMEAQTTAIELAIWWAYEEGVARGTRDAEPFLG